MVFLTVRLCSSFRGVALARLFFFGGMVRVKTIFAGFSLPKILSGLGCRLLQRYKNIIICDIKYNKKVFLCNCYANHLLLNQIFLYNE